ncbi:MAG: putative 2-dehydropantoate 2-reductase [Thermodesulfobacteriota bacterium]|nr:putative 2-dehydropantoate 2-reductase [Thermodesulfobacteriota bacterium]
MRYAIIGTGAVGGYYGGLLARHGLDIHFLLHNDYLHVKNHGLLVESCNGDFALSSVNAYHHAQDMPHCDVVIVALKTTQNFNLPSILPHVVKKTGIVVVLQNGLGVEKDIAQIVPSTVVIGGLCFLCSNKIGPGHIKHLDYGTITLGEYASDYKPTGITKDLEFISQEFKDAGIPTQISGNLREARWKKLVWNVPFNGLSVVLNATTKALMKSPFSRQLLQHIMIEVITGARTCGYVIEDTYADEMLKITEQMANYKPSMKLDFENGRPLEIDKMYAQPISEAESAGYIMTAVQTLTLQLRYLEERRNSDEYS